MASSNRGDRNRTAGVVKPGKPTPTFPLFAHANGQWCRAARIGGRTRKFYFGKWADDLRGDKALLAYLAVAADIEAGREPAVGTAAVTPADSITAGEVVSRFLAVEEARVRGKEIGAREYDEIRRACLIYFLDVIPEHVAIQSTATLQAGQKTRWLDQFRTALGERVGSYKFNTSMTKVRRMLRWAFKTAKLIRVPLHEDDALRKRTKKQIRREVRQREHADGVPIFTPAECRMLVAGAVKDGSAAMLAFILLGMNAGMGQSHISDLPHNPRIVDTDGLFVDWVRTKTEEICQFPLWPITAIAIDRYLAERPAPKPGRGADGLLFVTKYGNPWVQEYVKDDAAGGIGNVNPDDAIGKAFEKLQRRLGIKRPGRGFYALRRTFGTLANDAQDRDATRRIMGHGLEGMDPHYVRQIPRHRLEAVVSYVGHRLLGCVATGGTWNRTDVDALSEPFAPPPRPLRAAG